MFFQHMMGEGAVARPPRLTSVQTQLDSVVKSENFKCRKNNEVVPRPPRLSTLIQMTTSGGKKGGLLVQRPGQMNYKNNSKESKMPGRENIVKPRASCLPVKQNPKKQVIRRLDLCEESQATDTSLANPVTNDARVIKSKYRESRAFTMGAIGKSIGPAEATATNAVETANPKQNSPTLLKDHNLLQNKYKSRYYSLYSELPVTGRNPSRLVQRSATPTTTVNRITEDRRNDNPIKVKSSALVSSSTELNKSITEINENVHDANNKPPDQRIDVEQLSSEARYCVVDKNTIEFVLQELNGIKSRVTALENIIKNNILIISDNAESNQDQSKENVPNLLKRQKSNDRKRSKSMCAYNDMRLSMKFLKTPDTALACKSVSKLRGTPAMLKQLSNNVQKQLDSLYGS